MLGKNQKVVTPSKGACAAIATQNSSIVQYTVARQRTSVGFKLAVRGDSGAGGFHGSASTLYSILR